MLGAPWRPSPLDYPTARPDPRSTGEPGGPGGTGLRSVAPSSDVDRPPADPSHLEFLNTLCLYWTGAGVIAIVVSLLVKAPSRNSGAYAFGHFDASASGWPVGWSFFIGLLQAAYTQTGYGMVAALCEEVHNPRHEVPRAMVLSVVAAAITGIVYLLPILFVLRDTDELLEIAGAGLQPMPTLYKKVMGTPGGALGLLFIILGIWFFASVGSMTAALRCTWAFSRDGGIPGSKWWRRVNRRFDVPLNALILSTIVCALLGLIYLGSTAAFSAFTNTATICLGCSYAFPVLCSLLRGRKLVRNAPFSLGRFGYAINSVCCVWITFSIVLFCFPTAIPVTPESMNYASVVFAGFSTIAAIWYLVNARKYYKGPVVLQARRESVAAGEIVQQISRQSSDEKA
ncbi:MAG: amino acid permease [Cutibacterium acnes]|nr:amino acid permease [Cutibacterium acnes]